MELLTLEETLELHREAVTTFRREGHILTVYNIQCNSVKHANLEYGFRSIFSCQNHAFKINISCGYILQDVVSGAFSYWSPSQNNQLLIKHPTLIKTDADHDNFIASLNLVNIEQCLARPNTKYRLVLITNVTYYVISCRGIPIGCVDIRLPRYLIMRRGVHCLARNHNTRKPFNNNYCLFRCLAYHRLKRLQGLETAAPPQLIVKSTAASVGYLSNHSPVFP